jgi:hypothetical protein
VSIETQAPNPLGNITHIYSDNESSEPYHDTPACVQEEKGPKKTSSPDPEVQEKEVSQEEIEAESGLDTKGSNVSEAKEDLDDKPKSEESKKESPRKEINGSMANKKVSHELVPDIYILPINIILDEQQEEVSPTRHNKEVQEPNIQKIYTAGSLGNTLTWGDQQIPELVDEVAYIYANSYDQKRNTIIQRTAKKRRITLDHSILVTTEENLINTSNA